MATGPEHYREAEKLLTAANRRIIGNDAEWLHPPVRRAELRAEAQVHATLALAAATASRDPITAWREPAPTTAGKGE